MRYCDALQAAAKEAQGGVVIVDSTSHEHEGPGGYLEYHETELDRLVANSKSNDPDWKKREKNQFTAWIKPAADRRRLINTILQTDCAFIFCFRSKEKLKIVPGAAPIPLGWQAIAGDEFAYEMTVRCLLPPGAEGVPDWGQDAFKNHVAKLGEQHKHIFPAGKQLDDSIGEKLALWSKGEKPLAETLPNADDWIADIEAVPTLDGLKHKFSQAAKLFKDSADFARIHASKEKRKLELTPAEEPKTE